MRALLVAIALLCSSAAVARAADNTTLVLVVASNRGPALDRPPLQYADDDGAKYREVFASLAGEDNTVLLTQLDADTARLFGRGARVRSTGPCKPNTPTCLTNSGSA